MSAEDPVRLDESPEPPGAIFTLNYQDCTGADAPLPGEFNCSVLTATDPGSNLLSNVTCFVTLP